MAHLEEYLEITPNRILVIGHRVGLEQIVRAYRDGATAENIALDFPGLSLEIIYAALTYYLRNQGAVDVYIAEQEAEAEQAFNTWASSPPAVVQRLQGSHATQSSEV